MNRFFTTIVLCFSVASVLILSSCGVTSVWNDENSEVSGVTTTSEITGIVENHTELGAAKVVAYVPGEYESGIAQTEIDENGGFEFAAIEIEVDKGETAKFVLYAASNAEETERIVSVAISDIITAVEDSSYEIDLTEDSVAYVPLTDFAVGLNEEDVSSASLFSLSAYQEDGNWYVPQLIGSEEVYPVSIELESGERLLNTSVGIYSSSDLMPSSPATSAVYSSSQGSSSAGGSSETVLSSGGLSSGSITPTGTDTLVLGNNPEGHCLGSSTPMYVMSPGIYEFYVTAPSTSSCLNEFYGNTYFLDADGSIATSSLYFNANLTVNGDEFMISFADKDSMHVAGVQFSTGTDSAAVQLAYGAVSSYPLTGASEGSIAKNSDYFLEVSLNAAEMKVILTELSSETIQEFSVAPTSIPSSEVSHLVIHGEKIQMEIGLMRFIGSQLP